MASRKDKFEKKPLFRKVNTRTHNVEHNSGERFSNKRGKKEKGNEKKMVHKNRGLDYTPLYKFLLKNVGRSFDEVYSEAVSRLDNDRAIYYMVYKQGEEIINEYMGVDESTYYSKLYVDENGILQKVNPKLTVEKMEPSCPCCTHTFNGIRFTQKYKTKN